jgi:hypothetical protein
MEDMVHRFARLESARCITDCLDNADSVPLNAWAATRWHPRRKGIGPVPKFREDAEGSVVRQLSSARQVIWIMTARQSGKHSCSGCPGGGKNGGQSMLIRLAQHRLPAIYPLRLFCDAGGPISYGIDLYQLLQQAVSYVSLTSRGANPADLAGADQI